MRDSKASPTASVSRDGKSILPAAPPTGTYRSVHTDKLVASSTTVAASYTAHVPNLRWERGAYRSVNTTGSTTDQAIALDPDNVRAPNLQWDPQCILRDSMTGRNIVDCIRAGHIRIDDRGSAVNFDDWTEQIGNQ